MRDCNISIKKPLPLVYYHHKWYRREANLKTLTIANLEHRTGYDFDNFLPDVSQRFQVGQQQDAQEFLIFLMDVTEAVAPALSGLFLGKQESTRK